MKKTITIEFDELLSYAESIGYSWNKAHDIIDDYYPCHGPRTIYPGIAEENEENEDVVKIIDGFFKANNITEEVTILPKSS